MYKKIFYDLCYCLDCNRRIVVGGGGGWFGISVVWREKMLPIERRERRQMERMIAV